MLVILIAVLPFFGLAVDVFPSSQFSALKSLFDSTRGDGWTWRPPLVGAKWDFTTTSNPCISKWQGLNCSKTCYSVIASPSNPCTAVGLKLAGYNLTGSLPSDLGALSSLEELDLSFNRLTGSIPSSIGDMVDLVELRLGSYLSVMDSFQNSSNALSSASSLSPYSSTFRSSPSRRLSQDSIYRIESGFAVDSSASDDFDVFADDDFVKEIQDGNITNYPQNKLSGTLPDSLGNLLKLKVFTASLNRLNGTLPQYLGTLTALTFLSLNFNLFSGTIPDTVVFLTNLIEIHLNSNRLRGTIPTSIGNLTHLQHLDFSGNAIDGPIPESLYSISGLVSLKLYATYLNDTISPSVGNLTKLKFWNLYKSKMRGSIPSTVGLMSSLESMNLFANLLRGTIPSELGLLDNLAFLSIGSNFLTGFLPSELGLLMNVTFLGANFNRLTGTVPSTFGNLRSLYNLDLSANSLSGSIPPELGNLALLNSGHCTISDGNDLTPPYISFAKNQLDGTIPSELTRLDCLQYLLLLDNSLSGSIPQTMHNMSSLEVLDMSSNGLTGNIPPSISKLSTLISLSIDSNYLSGDFIPDMCCWSNLQALSFEMNLLDGTIPCSIGSLTSIHTLTGYSNLLSGTLPSSIASLGKLKTLLLGQNNLRGTLYDVFNSSENSALDSVDLGDNNFSGSLPDSLLQITSLTSLSLIKNCFHGSIPSTICAPGSLLNNIALDGLTAGKSCRIPLFSFFNTYTSAFIDGTIPSCLFSMKGLVSLQLSGNGLTGGIAHGVAALPDTLRNISVSNNRLGGTIPPVLDQETLINLDISSNEFKGTLDDLSSFFVRPDANRSVSGATTKLISSSLNVNDNRLSGFIPSTYYDAENINVVEGNFMTCDSAHPLPKNDPGVAQVECGTRLIDVLFIVIGCVMLLLIVLILVWALYSSGGLSRFAVDIVAPALAVQQVIVGAVHVIDDADPSSKVTDVEFLCFSRLLPEIRRMVLVFCGPILVLAMVLYLSMKTVRDASFSTRSFQYALRPSIAFLEGRASVWVFGSFFMLVAYCVIRIFQYSNSRVRNGTEKIAKRQRMTIEWIELQSMYQPKASVPIVSSMTDIGPMDAITAWIRNHLTLMLNTVFVIVNLVLVVLINGSFVYLIVTGSTIVGFAAQLGLVITKLFWNLFVVPSCLSAINGSSRHRADALRSGPLDVQVGVMIFNMVVSPVLAVLAESDSCFYGALVASPTITVTQVYQTCHVIFIGGLCFPVTHHITTSFQPPFVYSYQCSSSLLSSYTSVFIMLYFTMTFLTPALYFFIAFKLFPCCDDSPHFLDRLKAAIVNSKQLKYFDYKKYKPADKPMARYEGWWGEAQLALGRYLLVRSTRVDKYVARLVGGLHSIAHVWSGVPSTGLVDLLQCVLRHFRVDVHVQPLSADPSRLSILDGVEPQAHGCVSALHRHHRPVESFPLGGGVSDV